MSSPEKKEEAAPAAASAGGFVFGGTPFAAAAGGGFGAPGAGVAFTSFVPKAEEEEGGEDDGDDGAAEAEAECTAQFKPLVQLEEVATATGEEDEDIVFEAKAKSYRFVGGEWKEKGMGPLKLLSHKESKKVRVLMRRDKTLKVCVNFLVQPGVKLAEHAGSDKAVTVTAPDTDGKPELLCLRLGNAEKLKEFWKAYDAAAETNAGLGIGQGAAAAPAAAEAGKEEAAKAADALADSLGSVKVADADKPAADKPAA